VENKIIINGKEYTLEVEKTEYGDFYIGYWNGNDEVAETETSYLISGPGDLEETIEELKEKLKENEIKPGIDNKQYLWSELSEEEKQKLLDECEETGKKVKEKYPTPSLEAHKYWKSLAPRYCKSFSYFKKYYYDRKNN
jgi:hypothetical protein